MKRFLHFIIAAAVFTAFVNVSYANEGMNCCKSKKECSQSSSEDGGSCKSHKDCASADGSCKDKCGCKSKDGKCVCKTKDGTCKDKCKESKGKCGCKAKDGGCKDKCKCKTKNECMQSSSAKTGDASKDPTKQEVVIDPVCGMDVEAKDCKNTAAYQDKSYSFCSESCKKAFEKAPEKYIKSK